MPILWHNQKIPHMIDGFMGRKKSNAQIQVQIEIDQIQNGTIKVSQSTILYENLVFPFAKLVYLI